MNNLKKSIMSVAMAAITAASPILSSYAAYASDITVNDDGTVTQISTSTEGSTSKADETKFLFIKIKTAGGKVVLNEGEDQEQRIRLDKKTDGVEYIDVYDKNDVLISSESTKDNGYTYVYEAKADDAVSVKAKADEGYKVKLYELTDDSSGAEIAEDVGFDAGNKVDSFKYPVFMEYDKTVKIGFEKTESADDIAKDLSVNDKTGKDKADEQSKAEADVESEDKTSKKDEAESKETEDAKADGSDEKHDDANVDEASNDEDLTVDTAGDADTSDTVGDESKEESEAVNSSENSDTETEAENKNEDLTIDSKEEINADDAEADAENTDADSVKGDADIANADADAEAKEEEENVEESVEDSDIEEPDVNADETTKSGEHFTEISTEISSLDADLFSSARLVIMTGDANNIVDAEHIIANYDNIYLMQYSTVEQAMTAYLYYNYTASTGVIDAVEPDAPLEAADEKTVEGTAPIDETNVQVTADANPISSIEETKPAETKEATNVIALIDTGVSESANVIDRVSLIGDELEGNGHGDRMLQAIVGQNADASVLSIRTMGNDGRGTVSSIIAGMEYALQQNVKIINLSLSAKTNLSNSVLKAEIEKAVNAGVEVVAAAGNDNANVKDYMPGSVEAATVIGAADENGERMIGSNYGDTVDYNVVAGTTSEAAAKFSGFLTTGIDIMGVVNTDGLIYQPDYVAAETTVTPEVTKAPDEDLPDDEEDDEWTIGDYPSANSTVSKEEDVWYKDTAYEFDKYNPYGDDVIVKCETEGKTASFKIGDTVEFQYKYALKENPEYAWDLYCTFNFIDDRDLVTTKSDSVDKIFPDIVCQERNEGYRGVVPERTGETVTGKTFNILANTKNFELGGLLQDYNPETFKINSIDENGFDITKPGEYKVTFEMSYFMYANYTWFVEDTINVIDASSLEPGVYLTSSEPTLFFTNNDGMKGYAEFSKIDLSDNSYKISCVDGELKLAVTSSDDTVDINSFCTIADSDDNTKLLTINKAENDVPLIMYASRSDYESGKLFNGGGWKQPGMTEGQVDKVSDFEEYEEAVYNADVTDDDYMSVAGDYVLKGTFNTTCKGQVGSQTGNNHWGNGSTSPESNWATAYLKPSSTTGSFAASAKTRKQIIEFAAKYGANLKDSDFDDVGLNCSTPGLYGYTPWSIVDISLKVTVLFNGSKYRVDITGTLDKSPGYYQTFWGADYITTDGKITLIVRKRLLNAELAEFSGRIGELLTTFTFYSDKACTKKVASLRMNAKETDPEDGYVSYKGEAYVLPGTYYMKETYRIAGTMQNNEVYGPIKAVLGSKPIDVGKLFIGNSEYSTIGKTGWIYNKPFIFTGQILTKHNDSGEKLGGAIYRVQYSEYGENQFKSRRTWYLKTDEEGVLKFDEDHYLTSWKDSNGAIHKSGALVHQTNGKCALPIGFIRVREMEAPEGYGLDPKEYEVRIQAEAMDTTPCFLSYNGKKQVLDVTDPYDGGLKLGKFLYDYDNFAGKTDRDYIKTEFTIYKTFNANEPDNMKAVSNPVKTVKIEDTTKSVKSKPLTVGGLEPGTYYLLETGRCPGSAQNLNIYSFEIKAGQTAPTEEIKNVRTNRTGTKVGNQPFRYIGMILEKVDKDGKKLPLKDAIFKVVYSPYEKSDSRYTEQYTWFLKTDEKGEVFYDKAHWVDEFNGMKSDAPFILDNGTYAIPSGTLYVTEVKAPSGYGIDKKTHEFLMPAQKDENGYYSIKELTATPIKVVEPPLGKIWCAQVKLKKVDENGKGLKGAKFYIWDNEKCTGDPIGKLESGDNGESNIVQIDDIPWDNETYTVYCQEYEAPTNYVTIDDKFSVTFKRSDYEALYKADKNTKGKIEYFGPKTGIPNDKGWTVRMNAKKVNMNQDGLADAEFTIYKIVGSDKKEVGKIVSGDDGMTNELSVGIDNKETTAKFLCVETKAPNGHAISEESKTGYTLEFQKSTYDELYKADKDTKGELKTFGPTTGIPNPTVTITQPITPPITPPTTGTGLNVIKTSKAPDDVMELNSYTLEGAVFRVTSSRDGDMGTITTDASGYAGPLTLPDNSTKTWVDPATDKEGHVTRPGYWQINEVITTYYITEETPPKGHYKNNSTKSISVTMPRDAKQTFEVTFEDVPKFNKASSFDIEKLGVKGEPIEGVVFKVEYFDGDDDSDNPVRTWHIKTDSNGHARLGNSYLDANRQNDPFYMYEGNIVIPIGGYLKVTEVAAPAEYVLDDTPMGAKTVEGQDIKFTYANGNAWYNELQRCRVDLQKYEADGTTPIPGVEFEIEFLEAAIQPTSKKHPNFKRLLNVGEKTVRHTDTDGKVFFDNLDQGTYKITEIKTKDGNALLKEPIVFTLPFKMTNQEASEYGNVDFTTAKEDVGYSGKWYFYNCKYDITNNATFSMPMTGDDGKWKYGFIGLGMAAALASVWLVYETRNKKFRKRKHKK